MGEQRRWSSWVWVVVGFAGLAAGCQDQIRDGDFASGTSSASATGGPQSSGIDETEGPGAESDRPADPSTSGAGSTSGAASTGPGQPDIKLDVGGGDTPGGPGCSKIDFLFVVDNSGSMEDEQQNLVASFPGFFSTIENEVEAEDFHLMVVTTDGSMISSGGGGGSQVITCSAGNCTCEPTPDCCEDACNLAGAETCYGVSCGQQAELDECDATEGAGRRFGMGQSCDFESAPRFITGVDTNVEEAFTCASDVGTYGSGNEIPMAAMLSATSPDLNESGACNEGFLRDDAVLVVTFITDEEDDFTDGAVPMGSPGDPQSWHDDLIAHKGGQDNAVVVLGLTGDTDQPNPVCQPLQDGGIDGAEASPRLRAFVESFGDRGFLGSVCAPDYAPFFEQAVSIIDTTCDEYEPEG